MQVDFLMDLCLFLQQQLDSLLLLQVYFHINPILHGGGSNQSPLIDYCTPIFLECPEWADFSRLCFFQYYKGPGQAIFGISF